MILPSVQTQNSYNLWGTYISTKANYLAHTYILIIHLERQIHDEESDKHKTLLRREAKKHTSRNLLNILHEVDRDKTHTVIRIPLQSCVYVYVQLLLWATKHGREIDPIPTILNRFQAKYDKPKRLLHDRQLRIHVPYPTMATIKPKPRTKKQYSTILSTWSCNRARSSRNGRRAVSWRWWFQFLKEEATERQSEEPIS